MEFEEGDGVWGVLPAKVKVADEVGYDRASRRLLDHAVLEWRGLGVRGWLGCGRFWEAELGEEERFGGRGGSFERRRVSRGWRGSK